MRVLMAATTALDPANKLFDPDSDVLAHHPRREALEKAEQHCASLIESAKSFRDSVLHQRWSLEGNGMTSDQVNDVLDLFDTLVGSEFEKAAGIKSDLPG
jgi:hypothetical protein